MKILFRQCLRGSIYLLLSSFALPIYAQVSVSGLITDSSNMPIPGVNILLKNTTTGTTTNFEGRFKLEASPSDTLVVSYIGFKTQELAVREQVFFTINLTPEANTLAAVLINAGYYTTTDRERTGSIAKVTAKEIELQPVVSPLQALQGRMAGVEVTPGGNLPGAAPTIRIRGQNSLRKEGNYPLYIIDGVPISAIPIETNSNMIFTGIDPLSTLNVSNIESIEVLKDADATAIYGSRGANGVILITTKKGTTGKTNVQVSSYLGVSKFKNRINLLNTQQYLQVREKAFENDAITPNQYNAYDLLLWDKDRNTDWQEKFLGGKATILNTNISISGGGDNISYSLSGATQKQGSIFPGNSIYKKTTTALILNHTSTNKKLALNLAINYGTDRNRIIGSGSTIRMMYKLAPNAPSVFNEDGSLHWKEWNDTGVDNPLNGYFNASNTKTNNLITNLSLNYKLYDNLVFKTNFGYTTFNSEEVFKVPKKSYNPLYWEFLESQSIHLLGKRKSWLIEPQLSYNITLGKGELKALVGTSFQKSQNQKIELTGSGYVAESFIGDLAAAESISNASRKTTKYSYVAIFGRIGYNWKQKYYLNLTGRRDGSSRFGPQQRFANFGAVGAAWVFSKESWLQSKDSWFSFGKLRASYGTTGNDQISDYGYFESYQATKGKGGLYPIGLANPNYSWEVNKKLEAAVQLGFFKDKLNVNINWYRNRSSNQLVGYNLPAITGFKSVQANLPAEVENKGWELESQISIFDKEHWGWDTSFNISFPENKLISYPNIEESTYTNTYQIGAPLNINLLYSYEGIDPQTGLYKFTDINNDGKLDHEDKKVIKNKGRQYYGGINNNLRYKRLSVEFMWQFVKQQGQLALFNAGALGAQRAEVYQTMTNTSHFQTISNSSAARRAYRNVLESSLGYTDASFFRLKTLSFSYVIPVESLLKLNIDRCKVFVNGQNLITLTSYKGLDPEFATGIGADFGNYQTITAGIQLNF